MSDTDIKERLATTRVQLFETVSWAAQEKKRVAVYRRILNVGRLEGRAAI